jgi:hypothetical protein
VIALLSLLLILLPLYLWPLRGGSGAGALPGASSGLPKDPRDPAALAGIPGHVWNALMNQASDPTSGSPARQQAPRPRNLTMITEDEGEIGADLTLDSIGSPSALSNAGTPSPGPLAAATDPSSGQAGDGDPSSSSSAIPDQFGSWPASGQRNAGPWSSGGGGGTGALGGAGALGGGGGTGALSAGFPVILTSLPPGGSEPNFGGPILVLDQGPPIAPHPAPEPGTMVLVGLNVVLLSVMAWKHRRYTEGRVTTG